MREKRSIFAKMVAVMAVSLLLGVGLCGLDIALGAHGIGRSNEQFSVGPLDGLSLLVMGLSAIGLVVCLIAWAVAAIVGGIGSQSGEK